MTNVVIVSGARTPVGSFNGALATLAAHKLGAIAIGEAISRARLEPDQNLGSHLGTDPDRGRRPEPGTPGLDEGGAAQGGAGLAGNQVCGSGLRAVALGAQAIKSGDSTIVVAGGQESMSQAPHCVHLRAGVKMGNTDLVDTMINDGLWDIFNGYHMGVTAENVARQWQITREEQDAFAVGSQNKAEKAQSEGRFKDEIVAVTIASRKGDVVVKDDEYPRKGVTMESLSGLKPAFDRANGTVTAGNASGINDGAAALVLMSDKEAERRGLEPLARIVSWAQAGVDPALMGSGPIPASRAALKKAGWTADDLDLIEANEAFAAQACAVNKDLGFDLGKVNVNGGAIAIGHPIGASGARILVTLLHEMKRRKAKKGLATLCIGGGMGIALCVARDA